MAQTSATMAQTSATMDKLAAKVDVLTERTIQAMDAINRLAVIAAAHDQRLDNLERR